MKLTREELQSSACRRRSALAAARCVGGAALIWGAGEALQARKPAIPPPRRRERRQSTERLARIAEEEREVKEKIDVYQRLKQLNILGEERRLEWADAITRIRTERELLDLRYRSSASACSPRSPGKPGNVDFFASTMKVRARAAARGGPAALPRRPARLRQRLLRGAQLRAHAHRAAGDRRAIAPRLRAECEIDLITIVDRAAKR